jgi:hypothetical protein
MVFDIASVGGYHPAKLQDYEEFIGALKYSLQQGRLNLLDMMNARYIVSGVRLPDRPDLRPVWGGRDFQGQPRAIYENAGAYPRAWVVGAYRVASSEETLALMANGEVDLRHSVILDHKPALEPAPGDSAAVTMTRSTPREADFDVTLDRPGIVVLSEVYYPDWKAAVDGAPAEVLRANHVLRALALPAGRHHVVFTYDASLVRKSATISITTFVLTLLALLGAVVARRRRPR